MDYSPEEIEFVKFCAYANDLLCEASGNLEVRCPLWDPCDKVYQEDEEDRLCRRIPAKMEKGEELTEEEINIIEFWGEERLWKKGTCIPKGGDKPCPNSDECDKRPSENDVICTVLLRKLGRYQPYEYRILEAEINKIIRNNLPNIDFGFGAKLSLIDYEVNIPEINGRVDLLLKEEKTDLLVVVELKSEKATREHVGQLASYVGWYKENQEKMPAQTKSVKGILLAKDFSEGAKFALRECPDLDKRSFELHLEIKTEE